MQGNDLLVNVIVTLGNFVKWLVDAGTWLFTANSRLGNVAPAYYIFGAGLIAIIGIWLVKLFLPL